MQWKKETRTTQEETRKQHLQSKFPTSVVTPFLPKSVHLGSKLLVIALNTVAYHGFHLSTCTNEPFGEDLCARCEAVVKRHEIWNFNA